MAARAVIAARRMLTPRRAALLCGGSSISLYAATRPPALCDAVKSPAEAPSTATPSLEKRCIAEAIGTAIIVQGGCGAVCALKYGGANYGTFGLAAIWGASVALAAYSTRAISGAHLNPAVTCALVANDLFPMEEAPAYAAAQLAGATLAAAVNYAVFASGIAAMEAGEAIVRGTAASTASFAGAFGMVPNPALIGPVGALVAEIWMTGLLLFLIAAITDAAAGSVADAAAPALIGTSVAVLIGTFGGVTGCGMNPARDLGPRLVTLATGWGGAALTSWWVYTLGPLIGAPLGMYAYRQLLMVPPAKKAA